MCMMVSVCSCVCVCVCACVCVCVRACVRVCTPARTCVCSKYSETPNYSFGEDFYFLYLLFGLGIALVLVMLVITFILPRRRRYPRHYNQGWTTQVSKGNVSRSASLVSMGSIQEETDKFYRNSAKGSHKKKYHGVSKSASSPSVWRKNTTGQVAPSSSQLAHIHVISRDVVRGRNVTNAHIVRDHAAAVLSDLLPTTTRNTVHSPLSNSAESNTFAEVNEEIVSPDTSHTAIKQGRPSSDETCSSVADISELNVTSNPTLLAACNVGGAGTRKMSDASGSDSDPLGNSLW